ncbi:unnamed protein product [Lampetra fluviatilis]
MKVTRGIIARGSLDPFQAVEIAADGASPRWREGDADLETSQVAAPPRDPPPHPSPDPLPSPWRISVRPAPASLCPSTPLPINAAAHQRRCPSTPSTLPINAAAHQRSLGDSLRESAAPIERTMKAAPLSLREREKERSGERERDRTVGSASSLRQLYSRGVGTETPVWSQRVDNARVDDARVKDARVDNARVDDAHVDDAHVKDARVDDARVKDARV